MQEFSLLGQSVQREGMVIKEIDSPPKSHLCVTTPRSNCSHKQLGELLKLKKKFGNHRIKNYRTLKLVWPQKMKITRVIKHEMVSFVSFHG